MVATIMVCSNNIPRAGIMYASHKDCEVMVISGVLYFCAVSLLVDHSGSYSNSELKYTKGERDLSLVPRLFLGKRKWVWVRCTILEARELEQQAKVYVKECVLDLWELLQLQDPEVNSKPKKTARDKFRACENCDTEIVDRILVCAGCKKVVYCNYRCQKAHWKQHKKTCSYSLKKDNK